ncbi:uncharacterized protein [Haliotis cracherodii]|uniref:uncharacterized protein n=1 Tax=Haliotis cracherodii TaxID=6455 RepID=UPI0039E7D8E6
MMTMLLTVMSLLLLATPGLTKPQEVDRAKKTSDPNQWGRRVQNQANGCAVGGQALNHGAIFIMNNNPCIKYQCQHGAAQPVEIKCLDQHNRCHVIGSTMRGGFNGCLLMQCQANGVFQHVQSDPYKCKDINNVCRRPLVDRFPYNVNGYHVNGCTCKIEGGGVKYYCPQVGKK